MQTLTAPKLQGLDAKRFSRIRQTTEALCQPLATEDYVVQTCHEVSPPKWHLAHTSWFFEHFVLSQYLDGYERFDAGFHYLFNSYYATEIDELFDKTVRGTSPRPTVSTIYEYRAHVNNGIVDLLTNHLPDDPDVQKTIALRINIGIFHEEQHQELLLADLKHIYACTYSKPTYQAPPLPEPPVEIPELEFIPFEEGVVDIGFSGDEYYADVEAPQHKVYLNTFSLANRMVTCGEYLEFIEAGGYDDSRYWLTDGWAMKEESGWEAPLYWRKGAAGEWEVFTLHGMQKLQPNEPVIHVSYYEADAYARWRGCRLPTEYELEHVSQAYPLEGNFQEKQVYHPQPATGDGPMYQLFGDAWEWTGTAFLPYPGYKMLFEGVGEYNGKFMCNQMVMRGGCPVTPIAHMRKTYRNFYYPHNRWQFGGFRLAKDD